MFAINLGCVIIDWFSYHVIVMLGLRCAITLGCVILLGLTVGVDLNLTPNTPSVYANNRLQAGGGVDLDPPPLPNRPGGGSTLKFPYSWS